jgi:hypothetical protein
MVYFAAPLQLLTQERGFEMVNCVAHYGHSYYLRLRQFSDPRVLWQSRQPITASARSRGLSHVESRGGAGSTAIVIVSKVGSVVLSGIDSAARANCCPEKSEAINFFGIPKSGSHWTASIHAQVLATANEYCNPHHGEDNNRYEAH